ncbi:hypothetical protein [Streptomyces sp. NPDC059176]|uniref:hypothetical protein n=1 Tax=unclassified Streptomyces TaxID=2593676 RepID=UPI003683B8D7
MAGGDARLSSRLGAPRPGLGAPGSARTWVRGAPVVRDPSAPLPYRVALRAAELASLVEDLTL